MVWGMMVHMALHLPKIYASLSSLILLPGITACASSESAPVTTEVEQLRPEIIATHPFDATSFTQGLELDEDGDLLVGTGMVGESRVYRATVDGEELQSADLDPEFFGEGITVHGADLWQLTWRDGVAVRRDTDTLAETGRHELNGEGWGICSRQDELVLSDGSADLTRLDPETFSPQETIPVTLEGAPVEGLNELECVGDEIYANVFLSTDIMRIDAATGEVTAVIDAANLPNNAASDPDNVLNGIAARADGETFLLSGKRWPDLYDVRLVPAN